MLRLVSFICCLLAGIVMIQRLELRAVRSDLDTMAQAYNAFLSKKIGDKTLADRIEPDSLAVFHSGQNIVGCAIVGRPDAGR